MLRFTSIAALLLAVPVAFADVVDAPAATVPGAGEQLSATSFESFAAEWMRKVRDDEAHHRANPTVQRGAREPVVSYRGYGAQYSTEMRPTGHAGAPWVGLLRYTEYLYTCRTVEAQVCNVASTVPVTEIFRFHNGRWGH